MKDRNLSRIVVEDIWMNTQSTAVDDHNTTVATDAGAAPSWEEIEEINILLNPDGSSMESRG